MKPVKVVLSISIIMAMLISVVTIDAANAQMIKRRNRDVAKAAAVTSTPEQTEERQEAHEDNQKMREDRREDASPNQKAATYNVAKSRHQEKLAKQAGAASALSQRKPRPQPNR